MARNQEKAQTMLYRFREIQAIELGLVKPEEKRPFLASRVNSLPQAEKWRRHVIRDISKAVSKIHDGSLPENQIRDLNDQINKLLREKSHWETRIKEIGGPDYMVSTSPIYSFSYFCFILQSCLSLFLLFILAENRPENAGRRWYFGRARDLPGVRELLVKRTIQKKKKTKASLYAKIDASYYGYNDEDSEGELIQYEKIVSEKLLYNLEQKNQLYSVDSDQSISDDTSVSSSSDLSDS
ncbi:hypothetical protein BB561_004779 [Smittium simulii]|uniref:Pre-mRNA-splicing factor ISY1 n=1 Tax=Smittium simulii TaxID=133385 RepID=A0A2T9YEB2_9FUNG|nr:hypothetical protein BB561_004779 [Smittium simulii]